MSAPLDWLEDLRAGNGDEDPLVLFTTAEPALRPSATLGGDARHLDDFWPLADHLSEQAARPGPVVLFTDLNEDPAARAIATSKVARLLAESEARVLVVDGDFLREGLALLLDQREAEGFVDLVLYGASPVATCRPSGLKGVDVLPVGSFRPDRGEPFDDEQLHRAFAQLSGAYDLVLVSAPAMVEDNRYNALLVHADGIVLTPRRDADDPVRSRELLEYLRGQMLAVWSTVAFSAAVVPVGAPEATAGMIEEPAAARIHRIEEEPSSPLFRRITIALAAVLVAFLGWWGVTTLGSRDTVESPTTPPLVTKAVQSAREQAREAKMPTLPPAPEAAATDSAASAQQDAAGDSIAAKELTTPAEETQPAIPDPAIVVPAADPVPTPIAETLPEPTKVDSVVPDAPDSAMVRLEPGGGDYALHLWSFPDSLEATTALPGLVRDGYRPAVVSATVDGRLWYRVVVGRFAQRSDAMAARTALGDRPDVEYVGVVRVP